ncbi:MAG: hypothetical protein Q9218_007711 [Villophora microphyllina]
MKKTKLKSEIVISATSTPTPAPMSTERGGFEGFGDCVGPAEDDELNALSCKAAEQLGDRQLGSVHPPR